MLVTLVNLSESINYINIIMISSSPEITNEQIQSQNNQSNLALIEQVDKMIIKLDYSKEKNRKILANAIRSIQATLEKCIEDKFVNSKIQNFITVATRAAFLYKSLPQQQQVLFFSTMFQQKGLGNRHCAIPFVKVDNKIIDFQNCSKRTLKSTKPVLVQIESEPMGLLYYNFEPGVYPNGEQEFQFERYCQIKSQSFEMNIVAFHELKIPSNVVTLKVEINQKSIEKMHNLKNYINFSYSVAQRAQQSKSLWNTPEDYCQNQYFEETNRNQLE